MAVNYSDPRFGKVNTEKNQALTELEQTYAGLIDKSDNYYQEQIDASKQWADEQSQLQQEQTDFTIAQIEQQKQQAQKDYLKEQSGAYVDWQKQSDQYGANAEKIASAGMTNTGYAESSQVSYYNTYQNRVVTARESFNQAVLNFSNAIKDAQLQNNSVLAEIAYEALQQQLELSLQGFQYKNNLILEQTNKKLELEKEYYNRYLAVLEQINTENAMAEQIRQFNLEYNEKVRQFNAEIARLKAKDAQENAMQIQQLELQKQQIAEEKRQFDAQLALQKAQAAKSSGSGQITNSSGGYIGSAAIVPNNNAPKYTPSTSVLNKIKSLETMRGMMGSSTAIANSIIVYAQQGSITMDDAEYMLKYFGYNPDDYIE